MWQLQNSTPFAAERTFVRDRDGAEILVVAVRGTFTIRADGSVVSCEDQEPVCRSAEYFGDPAATSIRCDSDLVEQRPTTDVLVNASAYAPDGRPNEEVEVAIRVGSVRKRLVVTGDRRWEASLGSTVPGQPTPFLTMPIVYERAWGGSAERASKDGWRACADINPVGVGIDATPGSPLPNIRYPDDPTDRPPSRPFATGFGAVPSTWMPRRELAGTFDDDWMRSRRPLVPTDFRAEHFQAAPPDQQSTGHLRGGEIVELVNLTPSGGLQFQLPKYTFGFQTTMGGETVHHRSTLHTVLIEPSEARLVMVWHTALPCHHALYSLRRVVVYAKRDRSAAHVVEVAR